jgi:uncharacterized protein YhfF
MDDSHQTAIDGLPSFGFAFPGPLRDELTALVLAGTKRATAGLVVDFVIEGDLIPRPGDRQLVIDSDLRPVAVVETTRCDVTTIGRVSDEFARAEGEGYADRADWWRAHERFWNGYIDDIRRDIGDPDFRLQSSTPVVCEWFRVVERLDSEPLAPAPAPSGHRTTPTGG